MNIVIYGETPNMHSGWGIQLHNQAIALLEAGHNVSVVGYVGMPNMEEKEQPYPLIQTPYIPARHDPNYRGKKSLEDFILQHDVDLLLSHGDVWNVDFIPSIRSRKEFIWIHYPGIETPIIPVRSVDYSSNIDYGLAGGDITLALNSADVLVVFHEEARETVSRDLGRESEVISLGSNVDLYHKHKPSPEAIERATSFFHKKVNLEDYDFITLYVAKNQPRKQLGLALRVIQQLKNKGYNPLHIQWSDYRGIYNIEQYANVFGIQDNVVWLKDYLSPIYAPTYEDLSTIFNISNIYISTHSAEGWGLPILDAMACELPVVATKYAGPKQYMNLKYSSHEASEEHYNKQLLEPSSIVPWFGPPAYFAIINPEEMAERIIEVIKFPDEIKQDIGKANRSIAEHFSWSEYRRNWVELVNEIQETLEEQR